jgi:hypothetical protein
VLPRRLFNQERFMGRPPYAQNLGGGRVSFLYLFYYFSFCFSFSFRLYFLFFVLNVICCLLLLCGEVKNAGMVYAGLVEVAMAWESSI